MATMNKPCFAAIKDYSPDRPSLIFVASRRQTRLTAFDIISYAAAEENPKRFLGCSETYIDSIAQQLSDEALRHTITFGIGLHHGQLLESIAACPCSFSSSILTFLLRFFSLLLATAIAGLSSHDREIVETLYLSGDIRVLVATATLAWGVNLPARLVIVKGTEYFDGKVSRYVDYPLTDVLQVRLSLDVFLLAPLAQAICITNVTWCLFSILYSTYC
jgi:activating signal cointegrator complex subunit 3